MGGSNARLQYSSSPISVFMLCGLQGAGKTTMSAKLGKLAEKGRQASAAGRPAISIARRPSSSCRSSAVRSACRCLSTARRIRSRPRRRRSSTPAVLRPRRGDYRYRRPPAHRRGADAGAARSCEARSSRSEILLVVDAMTGQDAVNVAKTFNEKLDITGVILTKLDGDTRGGAALSRARGDGQADQVLRARAKS